MFVFFFLIAKNSFRESELSSRGIWQIAQEVVYQWLGDFATPFWWSDAHINKALASYLAAVTSFKVNNLLVKKYKVYKRLS